ncbi:MAG: DUF11 domain-containing protein [Deltaproteobacteria bacterium]|nr:DUF11 domain-containing protein [Deltaproteobacteria bacterium]
MMKVFENIRSVFGEVLVRSALVATIVISIVAVTGGPAWAVGTSAGTVISNTATVDFTISGTLFTRPSNVENFTVNEILNVTATWQDAADVTALAGSLGNALTFLVTNTGNGTDTYGFGASEVLGGDNFDPATVDVYIDNGDGVFDILSDTIYTGAPENQTLLADESITIFVVGEMPVGPVALETGNASLTVTSQTASGAAGTLGPGGEVVGYSLGTQTEIGSYVITDVSVGVVKSAVITDLLGGSIPIPGATIEYTLVVTATGTDTAVGVVITDVIPAWTTYTSATLTLNGGALTDNIFGDDAGDVGVTTLGEVTIDLGDMTSATGAQTIVFEVTIDQ